MWRLRDDILTNPITNDGILTKTATNQPASASSSESRARATTERPQTGPQDSADVERAQQRLTQETIQANSSVPADANEARKLADTVKQQLMADPAGALRAMGGNMTDTLFEAATARPTA